MRGRTALVALVAAGAMLAPAAPSSGEATPQPTYVQGITFGAPVQLNYADPARVGGPGEPSIKVDQAGAIYVAGVCCVGRGSPAWYSNDDGKTFDYLPSPGGARENGVAAEGDFVLDDADNVYFTDTWLPSLFVSKWSNHGNTWEYTKASESILVGLNDRPWPVYSRGTIHLYINHASHIEVWRSKDGGLTWEGTFQTLPAQRYWPGNVAADRRTDDVYLFGEGDGGCATRMCAAVSHDAGNTWAEKVVGPAPRGAVSAFMVSADVDAAGNVYGVYSDTNATGCDVYLAVSSDRGETWKQYRVNPALGCATFPWVAAGDDGRVAVNWYYTTSKKGQNAVPATAEWKEQAAVITDAASDSPTITYGTLDRVVHKGPLNRDLWDFQQIALGPDGRFHIAFVEDELAPCNGNLSTWGGAAAYTNKCTDYVAQTGGPRAILHGEAASSVPALDAAGGGGSIAVNGTASFALGVPVKFASEAAETGAPGLDVVQATVNRPTATSDELVFEMKVNGIPEVTGMAGARYAIQIGNGSRTFNLEMTSRPWSFQLCEGTVCRKVRGDTDAGSDRLVARVPLAAIAAQEGTVLTFPSGARSVVDALVDTAPAIASYTVPGGTVEVTADEVTIQGVPNSVDLSSFSTTLNGLAPGTYTVVARACYQSNCASATREAVVTGP